MIDVHVIGDDIYADGCLAAMLVTTGIPATVLAEFVDELKNGTLFKYEDTGVPKCPECKVEPKHKETCSHFEEKPCEDGHETEYDCAMADILENMKPFNKEGLIRWADLERIVGQLKEEGQLNEAYVGE